MRLKIINSNSSGNAYILENDKEALLVECGVHFDRIKKALQFNLKKVVGCIVTHEHGDHSKCIKEIQKAGITAYATSGTHHALGTESSHRSEFVHAKTLFSVGGFRIMPFDVEHDAAQPVGFLIEHNETGTVLFLTDTVYSRYTFSGINNMIIEANYCEDIINKKLLADKKFLRDRVIQSHMSIQHCKELLSANDLTTVNNIVLIHLSDGNSDAARFRQEVQAATGNTVHVAQKEMVIDNFNKAPF